MSETIRPTTADVPMPDKAKLIEALARIDDDRAAPARALRTWTVILWHVTRRGVLPVLKRRESPDSVFVSCRLAANLHRGRQEGYSTNAFPVKSADLFATEYEARQEVARRRADRAALPEVAA